jgi:hypothetical protein
MNISIALATPLRYLPFHRRKSQGARVRTVETVLSGKDKYMELLNKSCISCKEQICLPYFLVAKETLKKNTVQIKPAVSQLDCIS